MKFWKSRTKKPKPIPVLLLIEQFNNVISNIQKKSANSGKNRLDLFYDAEGIPVTKRIQIADNSYLEVPLISLVNNRTLGLSEFTVEFNANVDSVDTGELEQKAKDIREKGIKLDFSKKTDEKNELSIKLSYKE